MAHWNRRLTQREIDERERNAEFERRHRNCEDDPCDDCRPRRFCAEDDCPDTVLEGEYLCARHAAVEERSITGVSRWLLAAFIVTAMSLSVGCGAEPAAEPVHAAEPRPLEVPRPPVPTAVEVLVQRCAVQLLDDGQVVCVCEPATEAE